MSFTMYVPTKTLFGAGMLNKLHEQRLPGRKALIVISNGKSTKANGYLARLENELKLAGVEWALFDRVEPNPLRSTVMAGAAAARENGCDFIVALGGGSPMDASKGIAAMAVNEGDLWDYIHSGSGLGRPLVNRPLPIVAVTTTAGTGSETDSGGVITNEENGLKRGYRSDLSRQRFAVLNPELTYTLPPYQTANGAVDIMMHTMERYFTSECDLLLTDALGEGLMRTVMECARTLRDDPANYAARANMMWASSLSHNGLTGCGSVEDWASHQLQHELGGMFDCSHGAGLAAVWPSWARYVIDADYTLFARFAVKVMGVVPTADERETAERGVAAAECFFRSIGMPTNIRELGYELSEAQIAELAEKCTNGRTRTVGGLKKLDYGDIVKIYEGARG